MASKLVLFVLNGLLDSLIPDLIGMSLSFLFGQKLLTLVNISILLQVLSIFLVGLAVILGFISGFQSSIVGLLDELFDSKGLLFVGGFLLSRFLLLGCFLLLGFRGLLLLGLGSLFGFKLLLLLCLFLLLGFLLLLIGISRLSLLRLLVNLSLGNWLSSCSSCWFGSGSRSFLLLLLLLLLFLLFNLWLLGFLLRGRISLSTAGEKSVNVNDVFEEAPLCLILILSFLAKNGLSMLLKLLVGKNQGILDG